jgi:hypothetical protein
MKNSTKTVSNWNLFSWLKEITYNKSPWESFTPEQIKSFDVYIINRYLSMNRDYIELVNYVQKVPHSEKEKYYRIYCAFIPKKQFWAKYIKAEGKEISKEIIKKVMLYFECSSKHADEYARLLKKDELQYILLATGTDDKEIKKLLK